MEITDELLDKMARLARLELKGEERAQIKADFQKMLNFVEKLQEVDTTGIEPLFHMTEEVNHLREDKPSLPLSKEEALKNAPESDGTYFLVPKFVDKE